MNSKLLEIPRFIMRCFILTAIIFVKNVYGHHMNLSIVFDSDNRQLFSYETENLISKSCQGPFKEKVH